MQVDGLADVLLEAMTLKWMPRTGWQMRGVPNPESVAGHSFGVALTALCLAHALSSESGQGAELDLEKVMSVALLHDLAEARLTDLPASASRLIPGPLKSQAEASALQGLLAPLPFGDRLQGLWQAFEDASTAEGRLVRDADKLEMMLQCLRYEQAGCRGLDEFWQAMDGHGWYYPLSGQLYARLRDLHSQLR